MTDSNEGSGKRGLVQCILCDRDYERNEIDKYRQLGEFENYCLCEDCLGKEKTGWRSDR